MYIITIYIYIKSLQCTLSIPNKNAVNKPMNSFHSQVVITQKRRTPYACSFRRHIWASSRPPARKPACFRSISGLSFWVPITWALQWINPTCSIQCEFIEVHSDLRVLASSKCKQWEAQAHVKILFQISVVETKDANRREQIESTVEFSPRAYHTSWEVEVNKKKPCSWIATYKSNWQVPLFQQHHTFCPAVPPTFT